MIEYFVLFFWINCCGYYDVCSDDGGGYFYDRVIGFNVVVILDFDEGFFSDCIDDLS